MAVAASIDTVLTAKTEKFDKGLTDATNATKRFAQTIQNEAVNPTDKLVGRFIKMEVAMRAIKGTMSLIKSGLEKGLFSEEEAVRLESIRSGFNEVKDAATKLLGSVVTYFQPLILTVFELLSEGARIATEGINDISEALRNLGGAKEIKIVGLSDDARKRIASGELDRFKKQETQDKERAKALEEEFKTPMAKIGERMQEVMRLRDSGKINSFTASTALESMRRDMEELQKKAAELPPETQKYLDDLKDRASDAFNSTRTPLEEFRAKQRDLAELMQRGAISTDTYNRALLAANKTLADATGETKRREDLARRAEGLRESIKTPADRIKERIKEIDELFASGQISKQEALRGLAGVAEEFRTQREDQQQLRPEAIDARSAEFASALINFQKPEAKKEDIALKQQAEANKLLSQIYQFIRANGGSGLIPANI